MSHAESAQSDTQMLRSPTSFHSVKPMPGSINVYGTLTGRWQMQHGSF